MVDFGISLSAAGILLVFYLYLLVRPQAVKRCPCFLIGSLGLLLVLLTGFFSPWACATWARVLIGIFSTIGVLVAFLCAIAACFGGKLPVEIRGTETTEPPQ